MNRSMKLFLTLTILSAIAISTATKADEKISIDLPSGMDEDETNCIEQCMKDYVVCVNAAANEEGNALDSLQYSDHYSMQNYGGPMSTKVFNERLTNIGAEFGSDMGECNTALNACITACSSQ